MGASNARPRGLKARIEKLRLLRPPMVIAVNGRFLQPGSHEYEKHLGALAGLLSAEEIEDLLRARKSAV